MWKFIEKIKAAIGALLEKDPTDPTKSMYTFTVSGLIHSGFKFKLGWGRVVTLADHDVNDVSEVAMRLYTGKFRFSCLAIRAWMFQKSSSSFTRTPLENDYRFLFGVGSQYQKQYPQAFWKKHPYWDRTPSTDVAWEKLPPLSELSLIEIIYGQGSKNYTEHYNLIILRIDALIMYADLIKQCQDLVKSAAAPETPGQ